MQLFLVLGLRFASGLVQGPLPVGLELPVLTQGHAVSNSVVKQVTVGMPVAAGKFDGTSSLTIAQVVQRLFGQASGKQLALKGTAGAQEVAAEPALYNMEATGTHYSLQGNGTPQSQNHQHLHTSYL